MKKYLHEMHIFDLNASLYGNEFVLGLIIKGFEEKFQSMNCHFFHRLNSKTGNVAIYAGADVDLTHLKNNFLNGFEE